MSLVNVTHSYNLVGLINFHISGIILYFSVIAPIANVEVTKIINQLLLNISLRWMVAMRCADLKKLLNLNGDIGKFICDFCLYLI